VRRATRIALTAALILAWAYTEARTRRADAAFYEWGGPARRGVRQLKKGEDAAALHSFGEARSEQPASAAVRYDQGLAFRKLGLADSSRAALQDAMRLQGPAAKSAAAYNLGNEALRKNSLDEAIERYKESLRADPRRVDAKKNLEEALRRLRQAKPPQTPPSSGGGGSQGPSGPGSGGGGGGGNQEPGPPSSGGKEPAPPSNVGPIPNRSDAELWLDALESERRSERQREKQQGEPRRENVRDW
jgi:tetratricopeptide (TPR) repeat protein